MPYTLQHKQLQVVFLFLLAAIFLLVKSPDALTHAQFWAEDGAIFFAEQFGNAWPQLFKPYAGYLHFIPRLVAWIGGTVLPTQKQPFFFNVMAIAIDSCCIAYVASRGICVGRVSNLFLAFFIVPTAGDIFGSITNVQWFLQFVLFVACVKTKPEGTQNQSWLGRVVGGLCLLAAALTGPFSLLWTGTLGARYVLTAILRGRVSRIPSSNRFSGGRRPPAVVSIRWDHFVLICAGAVFQAIVLLGQKVQTPEGAYSLSAHQLADRGPPCLAGLFS